MLPPQKSREILFHLLYQSDFVSSEVEELFPFLMEHHKVPKKTLFTLLGQLRAIQPSLPEIDQTIRDTAEEYPLERIPKVERNILRLAIYELCISKAVPPKVVISEAIRLARKFATAETADFVNAILDALYKKLELHAV